MRTITKILEIKDYQIKIRFDDKTETWVDLKEKIESKSTNELSLYKQLLNKEYFKTVKLHPDWETIYWDNGLDFCPDTLYKISQTHD